MEYEENFGEAEPSLMEFFLCLHIQEQNLYHHKPQYHEFY